MLRPSKHRCEYCRAELEGRLRCRGCAQPPHEPQPCRQRVPAVLLVGVTVWASLMSLGISVLVMPGRVAALAYPAAVLALGLASSAGVLLAPIARRLRQAAELARDATDVGAAAPGELSTVRGRVRVRAPELTGGIAAERLVSAIESRRFEIVDTSGRAILVDDDALDLGAAGPSELADRLTLRHGDEVLARGRVRVVDREAGDYRASASGLALEGCETEPVRVILEPQARRRAA